VSRAVVLRVVTIAVTIGIVLGGGRRAHADNVDTLIQQLQGDDSDKVRLSAALNLAKLGDPRAIPALLGAVGHDSDKNVRGASAVALGKLVTDKTPARLHAQAVNALKGATANDDSDFVQKQAQKALDQINGGGGGGGGTAPAGGSIYINLGPMSSKAGTDDDKLRALMLKTAQKTLGKVASSMVTTWPGGGNPGKADLDKKGFQGFFVDGTLNEVKVKDGGASATVSCKISMLIASYPDKSMFGFLNGGASVQGSSSPADLALAREDCVSAVVESLITTKIVPTIKSKVNP
jgi:hypothetical protein